MKAPAWLLPEAVIAVHSTLIAEHGGAGGLRDVALLESALARPVNKQAYDVEATVFDLAAAYAFGFARNHPFVDGNKRISFTAVSMFLSENGYAFAPDKMEALETFLKLAAGDLEEDDLARWIEENCRKA